MSDKSSRLEDDLNYPPSVFIQTLGVFLGANYMYHRHAFRKNNCKMSFVLFLGVNLFTSY